MLQGSGGYGLSLLCLLLLSTSCRYLRSASFRLDALRHMKNPPETFPVDGRDPSTPQGDVKHAAPSPMDCVRKDDAFTYASTSPGSFMSPTARTDSQLTGLSA